MNDETKCHTPFCRKCCNVVHHDIIKALCIERNRRESSRHCSTCSHVLLRQCIQFHEQNGWDRNAIVPDNLPELRYPLVYLTCAFGKHRILETLKKLDFNLSVVTEGGENGLHAVVGYFYRVGNMKQCGGFMSIEKRQDVFEKVVKILGSYDPKIFSAKEKVRGCNALHMVAEYIVSPSRAVKGEGRCDPLKRSRYFHHCLEVMVNQLLQLKKNSFLTHSEVMEAIGAQNYNGNTVLHILAEGSSPYGWDAIRFILENFFEEEFFLTKNKQSQSAFDLLSTVNEAIAKKLFYPSSYNGREDNKFNNPTDKFIGLWSVNSHLSQDGSGSVAATARNIPPFLVGQHNSEIAVKAVWSEAGQFNESSANKALAGPSNKSLESVVMSLHSSAKYASHDSLKLGNSSEEQLAIHQNGSSDLGEEMDADSSGKEMEHGTLDQPVVSDDEPYPVFLPNYPTMSTETVYTILPRAEPIKQQTIPTVSVSCVSAASGINVENRCSTFELSPEASWMQVQASEESVASSSVQVLPAQACTRSSHEFVSDPLANSGAENKNPDTPCVSPPQDNAAPSSSGDSAFFDFMLTEGSDFNPAMKWQIVELIKGEFGKTMEKFNKAISVNQTEQRNLEAEIINAKRMLKEKEEEKLRLFAEIEQLQRNISEATEKQKTLVQDGVKLREESKTVKRKILSCEEVERELGSSSAKTAKELER